MYWVDRLGWPLNHSVQLLVTVIAIRLEAIALTARRASLAHLTPTERAGGVLVTAGLHL